MSETDTTMSVEERLEHIERSNVDRRISASTETLEVSEEHERTRRELSAVEVKLAAPGGAEAARRTGRPYLSPRLERAGPPALLQARWLVTPYVTKAGRVKRCSTNERGKG